MKEQEKYDWTLFVSCMTFNHASYIVDAMNGFSIQNTTFPFVCAIVDDASTDGEQEVIKKYLQTNFDLEDKEIVRNEETDDFYLTFARHTINKNCYFAVFFLKYNHNKKKSKVPYISEWYDNAKYRALCEGDDFWTHPNKLQNEVDYLEQHDDYAMVHTAYSRLIQETRQMQDIVAPHEYWNYSDNCKWAILTNDIMVGTTTVVCRTGLYNQIKSDFANDYKNAKMGDVQTFFHFARLYKIHYIPEITAVYRKHAGSSTSIGSVNRYDFLKNALDVHYKLATKYGAPDGIKNIIVSRYGVSLMNVGIDYQLYNELIVFLKEYHSREKELVVMLKVAQVLPHACKGLIKRILLYRLH